MPYLDHAATTPLRPEALDAMLPHLRAGHGNPSSLHGAGRRARVAVDRARGRVADVLGCEPGEVVFTSGGTEADNLALRGVLTGPARRETGRGGLVTSAAEHHAVLRTAEALATDGHAVAVLPTDGAGRLDPAAVAAAVTDRTGLASAMWVNNETGAVNDVAGLAAAAHGGGALFHTDAVQAAGLFALDVDAVGADLLSVSAHKVGGPTGVGALYVRAGTPFGAAQTGGSQERGRRGGTENVAAVVGFATALALAEAERAGHAARLGALRDRLRARVVAALPDARVNTPGGAAPHVLSVSFPPRPHTQTARAGRRSTARCCWRRSTWRASRRRRGARARAGRSSPATSSSRAGWTGRRPRPPSGSRSAARRPRATSTPPPPRSPASSDGCGAGRAERAGRPAPRGRRPVATGPPP